MTVIWSSLSADTMSSSGSQTEDANSKMKSNSKEEIYNQHSSTMDNQD